MKKRLLSLLLALVMLVGMLPMNIITANAATAKTLTGLHRGVLANGESPNMVYWDAVSGVAQYEVKVVGQSGTETTYYTSDSQIQWTRRASAILINSGTCSVSVTGGYQYGDRFIYETNTATINITAKHQNIGHESSTLNVNIVRGEELLGTLSEDGYAGDFFYRTNYNIDGAKLDGISGYPIMKLINAPNWVMIYSGDERKDNYISIAPPSTCENGSSYTFYLTIATSDVDGLLIPINVKIGAYQGSEDEYWFKKIAFKSPPALKYFEIYKGHPWYEEIILSDTQFIQGFTGDLITNDDEILSQLNHNQFAIKLKNADGTDVKTNTVIDIGKYRYYYYVSETETVDHVYFDENLKVYFGGEKVDVVIEDKLAHLPVESRPARGSKYFKYYSPWIYVYDVKPEINSVTVNGTSVADGGTITASSGTVAIKTNYDGLSDALTAYGCSVKAYASYYLNGEKLNVTMLPSVSNGNGTSTTTPYNRTLKAGDVLKVESWLEVTWPDGSKDRVDEHTVTAMYVDIDFKSIYPAPSSSELTNKYTDLGTMTLGSSATNIDFKAFPKDLPAAAISDGWTTGRSISVTRDGREVYSRTYAANELFGWNLKDNVEDGGTYLITLRVFAKKGTQIVEKTHKFRVFVKGSSIKTITLEGVATPVIGKSPSTIDTVKSNTAGVVVKKVIWNYWTSEMGGNWFVMPSGSKFEAGKRYAVEIELQTADGYSFTANKSDMTVYINGEVAGKSINYSSNQFSAELEFESISTPAFTTQPVGGKVSYGGKMTVSWQTNFTPCKIIVGEYNSKSQVVNQVEYSNTTTSVDLPANEYGYVVIAYYNNANAKYSNKITITQPAPAFTLQPADCVSLGGAYAEATWATNFTPVKLQLVKINSGPNGRPFYTYEELDANATYCAVEPGFENYAIRAYYNDTQYVTSEYFNVTVIAYYNAWFYVDDTVLDKVMVLEGEYVERPADPTKEGYKFIGWYTDDGEKYNFAATVTDDVHLTAKFEEISTPAVYVGGVGMFSGDYLAVGATATQTTKPSGGYAYYENGVLTLNNYSYTGIGFDDGNTFRAIIYAPNDIQIKLEGTNTLTQKDYLNTACIRAEEAGVSLTGAGILNLKHAAWGIISTYDISIEGGNLNVDTCELGIYSSDQEVIINGGSLKIDATKCAVNGYRGIEINGGNGTFRNTQDSGYHVLHSQYGSGPVTIDPSLVVTASTTADGELSEYVAANLASYKKIAIYTPGVYVGGVAMSDGDYLAVGATKTQTTKPSGGYAYYKNGTLTLNNYSYEGKGYQYDSIGSYANVYANQDLTVKLVGTNSLAQEHYYSDAIRIESEGITFEGTGSLSATSTAGYVGIYVDGTITVNGGTIYSAGRFGGMISINQDIIINGGNVTVSASETYGLRAEKGVVEINGGTVTATGTKQAIKYSKKFTVAAGMKIQASTTVDGALGEYVAANHDSYKKIVIEPDAGNVLLGDVNLDGAIDAKDLTLLARHVAKIEYITDQQALTNADINKDGGISSEDLTKLARHVAKIEYIVQ